MRTGRDLCLRRELAQEFVYGDAEDVLVEQAFPASVEQDAPCFGIVCGERLEPGEVPGGEFVRVLDLDCVKAVLAIDDEIDFLPRVRPPEAQGVASRAVVDYRPKMLEDESFQRGAVDLGGRIERPLGSDGTEDAGVEEIELVVSDEPTLRAPGERRQAGRHQQVDKDRHVGVHHRPAHAAVAGDVRRRVKRAMRKGDGLQKAREGREVADEPFILNFFADVDGHVGGKRLPPVVSRDDERDHAADKRVLQMEVVAHFRGQKGVAVGDDGASREKIHAAALQLARAGARQDVSSCAAVPLKETVHDGKNGADALHFVNDDCRGVKMPVNKFGEALRLGFQTGFDVVAQQVDVQGVGECLGKPCGFSGSAWAEKEGTALGTTDESLVLHGRYHIKLSCRAQQLLAKFNEKCKCRLWNSNFQRYATFHQIIADYSGRLSRIGRFALRGFVRKVESADSLGTTVPVSNGFKAFGVCKEIDESEIHDSIVVSSTWLERVVGDDDFGKVVPNVQKRCAFLLALGCVWNAVRRLHVDDLGRGVDNKIDFIFPDFVRPVGMEFLSDDSDIHGIPPPQEFAVNDIFHQMRWFDLSEVEPRVAQTGVGRVIFHGIVQIALPLDIITVGLCDDKCVFKKLKMLGDGRFGRIESGQCFDGVDKFCQVGERPDAAHCDIDYPFEQSVGLDPIPFDHVSYVNGLVEVLEIRFLFGDGIHQNAVRQPAEAHVFVNKGKWAVVASLEGRELAERKRRDVDDLSASAKFGSDIVGKHLGVGTCDVDVNVGFCPKAIQHAVECNVARFPFIRMNLGKVNAFRQDLMAGLNFINENIAGSLRFGNSFPYVLVKGKRIGQALVGGLFKVDFDDVAGSDTIFQQMPLENVKQKITFTATSYAS